MSNRLVGRRAVVRRAALALPGALLLAACGQAPPPTAAPAATRPAEKPAAAPAGQPAAASGSAAPLRVWFHWGGKMGDGVQTLIESYNQTQGGQDKASVTIETVSSNPNEYRPKMTAARVAGTSPDLYNMGFAIREVVKAEIPAELPPEESAYVRQNYVRGAVDRMTYEGKIWGYPTQFLASALTYRKSFLQEQSLPPPKTTLDVREAAKKLTKVDAGKVARYGFSHNFDNPVPFFFAELIARHGGKMFAFEGEKPVKVDVTSPPAVEAIGWIRAMVDDGSTQIGQMKYNDAWQNGIVALGEFEPNFLLQGLRDGGKMDVFNDLGIAALPSKPGVKPIAYANGWELVGDRSSKYSDQRWRFMGWLMHKPDVRLSKFVIEGGSSLPAPTDYPSAIPGWTKDMLDGYLKETIPLVELHPGEQVFGKGEMDKAISTTFQAIVLKQQSTEAALKELEPQLTEILKRNNP